ncbi:MAG TPA: hypothetical protein VFT78_02255 [Hanamia sp.]|nr:hypothetical protein [Hanamia sp.]
MKKILMLFLIGGSVLTASAQTDQTNGSMNNSTNGTTTTPTTSPTVPSTNQTTAPSTTTAPTTSTSTPDNNASVQQQHDYYFYPSQNVYYDKATGNYWYKETPTSTTWTETTTLPSTITVTNEQSYPIHYKGEEPYKNNTADLKKYKVKGNGTVKMKTDKK